jgi:hypothetical protein
MSAASIRCAAADGDARRAALRRAIRLAATAISSGSWLKRAVRAAGRAGGRVGVWTLLVGGIGMGRFVRKKACNRGACQASSTNGEHQAQMVAARHGPEGMHQI